MDKKKLLTSMYQNTSTAIQSISELVKKTDDKTFLDLLNAQYDRYDTIQAKIEHVAAKHKIQLKDNNIFEKIRMWSSIQMGTLGDNSTRHLAELMLVGTVMGTITCYKDKNDYKSNSKEITELILELEKLEEDHFNELKKYLKG